MAGLISWDDIDDEPELAEPKPASNPEPEELGVQPKRPHIDVEPFPADSEQLKLVDQAATNLQNLDIAPGLEELEMGGQRVQVDDKAMINCRADLNQLVPFRYDWAWQKYLNACEHHWMPSEVLLADDRADYADASEGEAIMLYHALAVIRHKNPMTHYSTDLAFYKHITNPECRQYILRHAFENVAHQHALTHYCETTGIELEGAAGSLGRTPIIGKKIAWARQFTSKVTAENMRTGTPELDQEFLKMIIAYYVIGFGVVDYAVAVHVFDAHLHHGRFNALAAMYAHIMSDRQRMLEFGILVVNQIKAENPHLWTEDFKSEVSDLFAQAALLEINYANSNAHLMAIADSYVLYMADKRASAIGLAKQFDINECPLDWMSQFIDVPAKAKKEETAGNGGALNW